MLDELFDEMPAAFLPSAVAKPVSFYFSLGECKKTVRLSPESCLVTDGKTIEQADCVCKTSPEFFVKIWREGYRPGMKDFLSGTIKSNDPGALQLFLKSFGKDS